MKTAILVFGLLLLLCGCTIVPAYNTGYYYPSYYPVHYYHPYYNNCHHCY